MAKMKTARLAKREEDHRYLGRRTDGVMPWEDGLHTQGRFGEYEWWYFDGKMSDGSSLVIIFYSQPVTAGKAGFAPSMSLSFTRPDGTHFQDSRGFSMEYCSFARSSCSVKMGRSFCEGDLKNYRIHYETDRATADVTLKGNIPSWRPGTGHILFGKKDYFAWLPSVPEGNMEATVTIGEETYTLTGTGYHDHNWGNKGMFWLMHHWYWGRAKIGPYTVISSYITAGEKYGYEHFPVFLLAKEGSVLGENGDCVAYTQTDPEFDPVTKKHFYKTLVYDYDDGKGRYRITYKQENIIEYFTLNDSKESVQAKSSGALRTLVRMAKLDPGYIRVTGTATLEKLENGTVAERYEAPAIWELMYFGADADV